MLRWIALAAVISVAFSEEAVKISKGSDVAETVEVAQEAAESHYPIYGRRFEESDRHHGYKHHEAQHELKGHYEPQEPHELRHHELKGHHEHHEFYEPSHHEVKGRHELQEILKSHEPRHHEPKPHYGLHELHKSHDQRHHELKGHPGLEELYELIKTHEIHKPHEPHHQDPKIQYELHELHKPHEPSHHEQKGHHELHELHKPHEPSHHEQKGHHELHELHKPHEPSHHEQKGHHELHELHKPRHHELKGHYEHKEPHEPRHHELKGHHKLQESHEPAGHIRGHHHEHEHHGPSVTKFDPHSMAHHNTPHGVGIIKGVLSPDYMQPTWFLDYRYVKTGDRDYAIADGGQIMILPKHVKNHESKEYDSFAELLEFYRMKKLSEKSAHLLHPEKKYGLGYMRSHEDRMEQIRGRMVHEHERHRDHMRGHYEH